MTGGQGDKTAAQPLGASVAPVESNGSTAKVAVPQKDNRPAGKPVPQNLPRPAKNEPVPQILRDDLIDESEDEGFDFAGQADSNWRIEQRFYTKKDGTIMLYWNYRSRQPVYINGERKIKYKKGGKKVWQSKRKKNTN
jgi:hypothetical protein